MPLLAIQLDEMIRPFVVEPASLQGTTLSMTTFTPCASLATGALEP